jgi:hypothetical protein
MGRSPRTRLRRVRRLLAASESAGRMALRRQVTWPRRRRPGPRLATLCAIAAGGALITAVAAHGGGPAVDSGLDAGLPYTTPSPVPGLAPAPRDTRPGVGSSLPGSIPAAPGDRPVAHLAAPPPWISGAAGRVAPPPASRSPHLLGVRPPALLASVPPVLGSVTRAAGSLTRPVTGLLSAAPHPVPSAVRSLLTVHAVPGLLSAGGGWGSGPLSAACCGAPGALTGLSAVRRSMAAAASWPRLGAGGWGAGASLVRVAPLRPGWAPVTGGWRAG